MIGCDTTNFSGKFGNIGEKDTERTQRAVDKNTKLPRGRYASDSETADDTLLQSFTDMDAQTIPNLFTYNRKNRASVIKYIPLSCNILYSELRNQVQHARYRKLER